MMNTIAAFASRLAPTFIVSVCQTLTHDQAYRFGSWLAPKVTKFYFLPGIKKIRATLAVVLNAPQEDPKICLATTHFLENLFCSYVDLFKALRRGREHLVSSVSVNPRKIQKIKDRVNQGQSVVIAGVHTCGFDFGVIALTEWLPDIQIISKANPKGENKFMHKMRLKFNLNVTPISMNALRQAFENLKRGGIVTIANDLLVEDGEHFTLFGRQVPLSTGHARLAIKSGSLMIIAVPHRISRGRYHIVLEEIPQPLSTGNKNQDILNWAQTSYKYLEKYIRRWPEEWFGLMFGIFGS